MFPVWIIISWSMILVLTLGFGELWRRNRTLSKQINELMSLAGRLVGGSNLNRGYTFMDWHRLASEALLKGVFDLTNPEHHLDEAKKYEGKALEVATTERQKVLAVGLVRACDEVRRAWRSGEQND